MTSIYLDCNMGAAGDMISAALLELMPDQKKVLQELNELGIPGVHFIAEKTEKCGVKGTHLSVLVHGEEEAASYFVKGHHEESQMCVHSHVHHHMKMSDVKAIVDGLDISGYTRKAVLDVYRIIADAESEAHQSPVEEVHFHEVGAMDAIADIAASCFLMEKLDPEQVIATPVRTGIGTVRCAHGILPVPAPATANILKNMHFYAGEIEGEMCTPTGAALLKYFVTSWTKDELPVQDAVKVGRGMGTKDFPKANGITAYLVK